MDQGRARLFLGLLLYICLAIGLIIFAVLVVRIAKKVENLEHLDGVWMSKQTHNKTHDETDIEDLLEHDALTRASTSKTPRTTTAPTTTGSREVTYPAPEYYILLNNRTEDASGKIYIEYGGRRGFVCNDGFDDKDAQVVCREKGFKRGLSYNLLIYPGYQRFTLDEPILSNLQCSGNEAHLYQCPNFNLDNNVTETCTSFATVLCYNDTPYKLRFVNSLGPDSGQIQIYVDGQWGTFCAIQKFNDRVADLVCREMNYTRGEALQRGTGGPATKMPIWVPWISCDNIPRPKSLFECSMVLHTENIPYDYFTHWGNRYRNMYYACIDKTSPYAPAVQCYH